MNSMIGMEVHVQLNTNTKLFCGCTTVAEQPNTATCAICLGHPGSKPRLNKRAIEYAMKLALALGCRLNEWLIFSRKTYFYPDMSKNYQITQYEEPLASGGEIILDSGKKIRIRRLHVEEDPAAIIHQQGGTLIDYNRSGVPLVEIVTEPDMESPDQAREFMKKLFSILQYLDIFSAQTGIVKADANVSVATTGYTRVEIKNITGFKEIERALTYEIDRQGKEEVLQETRGWNADTAKTYVLRSKESEQDYGYITDPDIAVRTIEQSVRERIIASIPELPAQKTQRYVKDYALDPVDAATIASDPEIASAYEEIIHSCDPQLVARWVRREIMRYLNDKGRRFADVAVSAQHLVPLFTLLQKKGITDRTGQRLLHELMERPFDVAARVKQEGLEAVTDHEAVASAVDRVLSENQKAVADYAKGETAAFEFLVGQVMRQTKGQAQPAVVREQLKERLG